MLFHVTWETYPTVVLDDDKRVREAVGPQLGRLMESNKVREAGSLAASGGLLPRRHRRARRDLRAIRGRDVRQRQAGGAPRYAPRQDRGTLPEVGHRGQVAYWKRRARIPRGPGPPS